MVAAILMESEMILSDKLLTMIIDKVSLFGILSFIGEEYSYLNDH